MIPNHVGFSGSRLGMSEAQQDLVRAFLEQGVYTDPSELWFHHGLCIGGDEQSHIIAKALGYKIHGHPPLDNKYTMDFEPSDFDAMDKPWSYHGRNQRIVKAVKLLIATPYVSHESTGGTWYTIGYSQTVGKPCIIIYRDGRIERRLKDASAY